MKSKYAMFQTQPHPVTARSRRAWHCGFLIALVALLTGFDRSSAQTVPSDINVTLSVPDDDLTEGRPFTFRMAVCNDGSPGVFRIQAIMQVPGGMAIQSVTPLTGCLDRV